MRGGDPSGEQPAQPDCAGVGVEEPTYVWTRPDTADDGYTGNEVALPIDDLHLHRYCAVPPFDSLREDWEDDEASARYLGGPMRAGLRHTPSVIAAVVVVLLLGAELSPEVQGVSVFLPDLPLVAAPVAVLLAVVWAVMMWLLFGVGLLEGADAAKGLIVYGLFAVLAVGTCGSVYLVLRAGDPTQLTPNVIYVSGYLLMLLVCGMLVYDGMLKTEHLLENLPDKLLVSEDHRREYELFLEQLSDNLTDIVRVPIVGSRIPTYAVFAPLFVSQFGAVWLLQSGPQGLGWWLNFLVNVTLNLFVVAVAFQFLVLIKAFHELVTGNVELEDEDGNIIVDDKGDPVNYDLLTYRPFHPDGHGGFRDLGKFATRVNVILIIGGLYAIFRLYVQGARSPVFDPTGGVLGALGVGGEVAPLVWLVSYVGPVLVYGVAAAAWLYYSFWHLHVKMAKEREQQYTEWVQRQRQENGIDAPLGDIEDAADWLERRQAAPVWPIQSRQLFSLVSGTLVPLLFSIQDFLL